MKIAGRAWYVLGRLALSFLLVLLFSPSPSLASKVRPLNLEEMTERADRIFQGRCVGVRVAREAESGQKVTFATFVVDRAVKGDLRGSLKIKILGEQVMPAVPGRGIKGLPRFRRGEEVILFLYGNSRSGLTSPVGFGQGKFTVHRDKHGGEVAVNAFGNELLLRGLSSRAERILGERAGRWRDRKGVPPEALLGMVESLRGMGRAPRADQKGRGADASP